MNLQNLLDTASLGGVCSKGLSTGDMNIMAAEVESPFGTLQSIQVSKHPGGKCAKFNDHVGVLSRTCWIGNQLI